MSLTSTQPRQPRGIPAGGEFATFERDEALISLNARALDGYAGEDRTTRVAALRHGGFVPAAPTSRIHTRSARAWWDAAYVRAQHGPEGTGYPKMVDAFDAHGNKRPTRRQRRNYSGGGVDLQMPSVTQIRAFSRQLGHETFDVPVSATFPGGSVQGWVRVTRNAVGQWSVSGPNMTPEAQAWVGEAVSALLEARTVSTALTEKTDLMARRRHRFAQAGIEMSPTKKSTFISGVGYNSANQEMAIKIGNRHYSYKLSKELFERARGAKSPGEVYNEFIKGGIHGEPLSSCEKCGRFYAVAVGHRCPSRHFQPTDDAKVVNEYARERARRDH